MQSCPKCGSVRVSVGPRIGKCLNDRCKHQGPARTFQGLSGQRENPYTDRNHTNLTYGLQAVRHIDDLDG